MSPLARRRSAELASASASSRARSGAGISNAAAAASPAPMRAALRTTWGSTDHTISKVRSGSARVSCPGRSQPARQAGWSGASQTSAHSRCNGEPSAIGISATGPDCEPGCGPGCEPGCGPDWPKSAKTSACSAVRARSIQRGWAWR